MVEGLAADLALLHDAAREGGVIALRHFGKSPETWYKEGLSPVTAADIAVGYALHLGRIVGLATHYKSQTAAYLERLSARPAFLRATEKGADLPGL